MEAKELRIGNLVHMNNQIVDITGILKRGFYFGKCGYAANILDWFEPIPLTEEWFIKFGFEKGTDLFGDYPEYEKLIKPGVSITLSHYFECYQGIYSQKIKYVHQLQNLYFALTGEELIIK